MNKNIALLLISLILSIGTFSQEKKNDQRTLETKIADLIMNLPAKSSAELDQIISELSVLCTQVIKYVEGNLVPPGQGDDVISRYVISGMAKHAAGGKDKALMKACSGALCESVEKAQSDEVKDFLLQELQYVAGNEAVATVAKYLQSERLCDPAARVLIRINSDLSNKALAEALSKAAVPQQAIIAEALGKTKYLPSAEILRPLASSTDINLKKTVLRALAEIGDMQSASMLASEAEKAGFSYNPVDAAGSYLLFLGRIAENGNKSLVEKSCMSIIKSKATPVHAKGAALEIYTESAGNGSVPQLLKSLKSDDKEYRMKALALMDKIYSPELAASLLKRAKSAKSPELKSELITMFADQNDKDAYQFILSSLQDKNKKIQLAAIQALAKIGKAEAVDPLIAMVGSGDTEIIAAAKTTLLTIGGESVAKSAAAAVSKTGGAGKTALIDIIAARKADQFSELVFREASGSDSQARLAAARALQSVSHPGDEARIATLLENADTEDEISALQEAMYVACSGTGDKADQVALVLPLMKKAGAKGSLYYNVLAKIGGEKALAIVEKEFEKGDGTQKGMALKALSGWSDFTVLDALYRISKNNPSGSFHDEALTSYISGINRSKNPADQKVLMFRKAMDLTTDNNQKRMVIQGISRNPTLLALVFVSHYLDDAALQQDAVQSVRTIVLANSDLFGKSVEKIVQKSISMNKDPEAEYQKQALQKHMASLPSEEGFVPMFNEKDLAGWKGLVENPISRSKMTPEELAEKQKKADENMRRDWKVENGILVFEGKGYDNLCSVKMYEDFELILDWRMEAKGDGGVYLRGSPQVQTWDTSRVESGAQVGSGGLYNNKINESKPLVVADNPINEWNTFRIKMTGEKVTVFLNGQMVVDNVTLENYWDRNIPIFSKESIELQAHGTRLEFRDIYVREIPRSKPYEVNETEKKEGFVPLFNGIDMTGWMGNLVDYFAKDGELVCEPTGRGKGNLYTTKEYSNFIMRFDFQLTPGANNGLGIRTPNQGDAAYAGMELQILDNEAEIYKNLQPYQYHGSVYGVIPAKRGFLKPVGEWNSQEVQAAGNRIKVILNGEVIVDGDIARASKNGKETADHREHPGLLNRSGYIGFLGHGSPLKFRNLRIKELVK